MKLKSKGLGRRELVMDFREYEVSRDGDEVVVSGTIKEPVHWDFSIRFAPDDIPGMLRVGLNGNMLRLGLRWAFGRKGRQSAESPAEEVEEGPRHATADREPVASEPRRVHQRRELGIATRPAHTKPSPLPLPLPSPAPAPPAPALRAESVEAPAARVARVEAELMEATNDSPVQPLLNRRSMLALVPRGDGQGAEGGS